jgi:trehalose utilization protein
MIRVTVWNENVQENGELHAQAIPGDDERAEGFRKFLLYSAHEIKKVHPEGIHMTLKGVFEEMEDVRVTTATLDMPECGLTDELLDNTDVLVWWAHIAHEKVPDEIAEKVRQRVLTGMGFMPLHSAHPSKPLQKLLGTTGSLGWREEEFCRVWNVNPTHPIAEGIPMSFELPCEEMYSEYFDVPKPDDQLFISWYRGGEVFRSGLTWTRGMGRIFYFQPGHETNLSYFNPHVRRILQNGVRWVKPTVRIDRWDSPHVQVSPEAAWAAKAK